MNMYRGVAAVLMLSAVPVVAQVQTSQGIARPTATRGVAGQPISPVIKGGKMFLVLTDGMANKVSAVCGSQIALSSVSHDVGAPASDGAKRMHKPITITMEAGRCSAQLQQAITEGQVKEISIVMDASGRGLESGRVSAGRGSGKVCLQDISMIRGRQASAGVVELTLDYGNGMCKGGDGLEDMDTWNPNK